MIVSVIEIIGSLSLALLVFVLGFVFKIFLDYEDIKPGAARGRRGRVLFRLLFIAPDLILLSLALIVTTRIFELGLPDSSFSVALNSLYPYWFWVTLLSIFISMNLCILLWFLSGKNKYIPIHDDSVEEIAPDGTPRTIPLQKPMWSTGIWRTKPGRLVLVIGNLIGINTFISVFTFFIVIAFNS